MLPTGSEKALRKLVIELAEATPEDIAAVLGMLDARARAMVRSLLAAYTDFGDIFDLEATPPIANTSGLSDWLAARTLGQPADGDDYHLTPKTADTLRAIVASLPPVSVIAGRDPSGLRSHLDGGSA